MVDPRISKDRATRLFVPITGCSGQFTDLVSSRFVIPKEENYSSSRAGEEIWTGNGRNSEEKTKTNGRREIGRFTDFETSCNPIIRPRYQLRYPIYPAHVFIFHASPRKLFPQQHHSAILPRSRRNFNAKENKNRSFLFICWILLHAIYANLRKEWQK